MKAIKFLRAAIVLLGILLSACAPAANSAPGSGGGGKALADVVISGAIKSMNGDQWVVNGKTVRVDPSVLRDEPFAVGDTVKVEASMSDDGTVTPQRVETPAAGIPAESASRAPDDTFSMPDNSATPQPPIFDDQGNEAVGIVDAVADTSITVGGQTYTFAQGVEFKGEIVAGASVKLHFTVNADGTFSVTEIELTNATQLDDDNSTDDSSAHEVNDDHGGETNINDDGANHDVNDDHGGNSTSGGGSDGNSGSNSAKGG